MSDEIIACFKCGFKMCKSMVSKTAGRCPVCKTLIDKSINEQAKAAGITKTYTGIEV
jgi:predicted Zn-ribbon and HTH transcriptional regulator